MNKKTENIIKNLLPPIALEFYRNFRHRGCFVGNFSSWEDACKVSSGYDADAIIENVKNSSLKVKNGEALFERDSALFYEPDHWWPLLSGLLWVATRNGNRLNLLDYGGSLGTVYYRNIKFLNHINELRWNVVEQKKFVEAGKLDFENEHLRFYYTMDDCISECHPDAILFSGVIQYLEKPYDLLSDALSKGFKQIVFDRTPFLKKSGNDRITVQRLPPHFATSYPAWFFNQEKFVDFFAEDYEIMADFDSFDRISTMDLDIQYKGFLFQKRVV